MDDLGANGIFKNSNYQIFNPIIKIDLYQISKLKIVKSQQMTLQKITNFGFHRFFLFFSFFLFLFLLSIYEKN